MLVILYQILLIKDSKGRLDIKRVLEIRSLIVIRLIGDNQHLVEIQVKIREDHLVVQIIQIIQHLVEIQIFHVIVVACSIAFQEEVDNLEVVVDNLELLLVL